MWQENRIPIGNQFLSMAVSPPVGEPLLLLHGVLRCWRDYLPLLPSLSSVFQIYGLDFRGHGQSAWRAGCYSVTDYVDDALAVLRSIGKPTLIYGHSLGAMVAAAVAAAEPRLVRGIVMEDPPLETLGRRIRETGFHQYFNGVREVVRRGGSIDELCAQLGELRVANPKDRSQARLGDLRDATSLRFSAACLANVDPAVLDPLVEGRWLEGYDTDRIFAGIQCPALLLQGDTSAGGMLYDDDAAHIERLTKRCARIRFPGIGHLIHWSTTQDTLRYVLGFLGSILVEGTWVDGASTGDFKWDAAHEDGHRRHDYQERSVG